jgi:hypothetical protein
MRIIEKAGDVSSHMLVLVDNAVDDWINLHFTSPLDDEAFIDRLCRDYANADGWDIENLDTPAVRKIMRAARQTRREALA